MTRRPVRRQDFESGATPETDASGSRVDAWLATAAERESAAASRPPYRAPARAARAASEPADAAGPSYDALRAAAAASERRAMETAEKTAAALGSVASWIEQAQGQLSETARAAARTQEDVASTLKGAVGTIERRLSAVEQTAIDAPKVDEALRAIQRIDTHLAQAGQGEARSASEFEAAMRSFESRIGELTARVSSAPRPIGRRGLVTEDEIGSAVSEIRTHQGRLDGQAAATAGGRSPLPALGTLARSQTAILTTLKADIARLANRMDETPSRRDDEGDATERTVETLRTSLAGVATRDDIGRLEFGLQALTADITELRLAGQRSFEQPGLTALQDEIRRLAEGRAADVLVPLSRDIEELSHKLDRVAAGGASQKAIGSLAGQIEEVQRLLAGAGAPQALALVDTQLAALRREVTAVGGRQVGAAEFAALRETVDDIQASLSGIGADPAPARAVAEAVRDLGQPIESMLTTLMDKLDRVERRVSDPDALDHLERQIQGLAARIGEGQGLDPGGRDPAHRGLERQMDELLREVAAWRDGAIEAAEHAARTAVTETIGSMPVAAEVERHLAEIGEQYGAAEARTRESLLAVHSTIEEVRQRLTTLETGGLRSPEPGSPPPFVPPQPDRARPPAGGRRREPEAVEPPPPPARRAPVAAPRFDAAEIPPALAPEDEILLEPGAGRPSTRPGGAPAAPEIPETVDIKTSFIAAARRAAQAAAAESATSRPKEARASDAPSRLSALSPADLARRVRRMIEERRRPLLLSAAALVLAIGTLQVVRTAIDGGTRQQVASPAVTGSSAAAPRSPGAREGATPAPIVTALATPPRQDSPRQDSPRQDTPRQAPPRSATIDPVTTQSIGERTADPGRPVAAAPSGAPAEPRAAVGAREAVSGEPAAAPPATPALPIAARAALGPDPAGVLPVGLKQAAFAGNPVALYELASRTVDGRGVARDPKAAAALFEKAADKGLAPAQYRVGNHYERGLGVTRDLEAAKTWYRRAAEGGNTRAMHNLAVLIAEGGGAKPDYPAAIGWFTKAAEHGIRDSQFNLAVLHARGLGVPQDFARSYVWLALAAQGGDEDAGRKRDEIAARLSAADLAKAKSAVERWKAQAANPAANEVQVPAAGWPDAPVKRASLRADRS